MYDERKSHGKTDMAIGHPLWHGNNRQTKYSDDELCPTTVAAEEGLPNIWWSSVGQGVYALRRPSEKYDDGEMKVVALQSGDETDMFLGRLQSSHEVAAPHRVDWALGHLGVNMSVAVGSVEIATLPWWASAAGIATAGLSYAVHTRKIKDKRRLADKQEVEAFVAGDASDSLPATSFTLHEHENGAQWVYRYGNGTRNGITQTEQLLEEDCSDVFAHEVGETVDTAAAKERVEALLEWLSPTQGKDFFKKQLALREAGYNAEKFVEIMEGAPADQGEAFHRRLWAKDSFKDAREPVFLKQNTLFLALKRMDDANGFIQSYLSYLQSVEAARSYYDVARRTEDEAKKRTEVIGDSLQDEYQKKHARAVEAERVLRHKVFQLSYMAMRWDKNENIPVPPDAVIARDVTTAGWRESLAVINTLVENSSSDSLKEIIGRFYFALQNQQSAKNDDVLNRQLAEYLTAAVAVAKTEDHYVAIEREVEQSYGEYLGLIMPSAQSS
jgi:hypothetical protein